MISPATAAAAESARSPHQQAKEQRGAVAKRRVTPPAVAVGSAWLKGRNLQQAGAAKSREGLIQKKIKHTDF
jgi:hypothetical protein